MYVKYFLEELDAPWSLSPPSYLLYVSPLPVQLFRNALVIKNWRTKAYYITKIHIRIR
jgi:hypothetical protein